MENEALPNMSSPNTSDVRRMGEAIARLHERGALKDDHCPQCNTENWDVDFVAIQSVPLPDRRTSALPNFLRHGVASLSLNYIPALTFVCTNCGYTMIFNLKMLGLLGGE